MKILPTFLRRGLLPALALVLLPLTGCGPGNTAPVSGTVAYDDGSPVTGGEIILHPVDDAKATSPIAYIRPDGTFEVFTAKPGDGARVGKYRVTVTPPTDDYGPRNPLPIDRKFGDPATSGFECEVVPGPNTLTLKVHRPKR
jgi:hypothetical protein